jgi:hypothetical protein
MRIGLAIAGAALSFAGFPASTSGAGWSGRISFGSTFSPCYLFGGDPSCWTEQRSTWTVNGSRAFASDGAGDTWTHPASWFAARETWWRQSCPAGFARSEHVRLGSGGGIAGGDGPGAESSETITVTLHPREGRFTLALEAESSFPVTTTTTGCDGVQTSEVFVHRPLGDRMSFTETLPADFRTSRRIVGSALFGNLRSPDRASWDLTLIEPTYDPWPPQTRILARPARVSASRVATFRFSSDEASTTFACRLDRGRWNTCRSPKTYRRLRPGAHTFRVRARDRAGNVDATPARYTWRVR